MDVVLFQVLTFRFLCPAIVVVTLSLFLTIVVETIAHAVRAVADHNVVITGIVKINVAIIGVAIINAVIMGVAIMAAVMVAAITNAVIIGVGTMAAAITNVVIIGVGTIIVGTIIVGIPVGILGAVTITVATRGAVVVITALVVGALTLVYLD